MLCCAKTDLGFDKIKELGNLRWMSNLKDFFTWKGLASTGLSISYRVRSNKHVNCLAIVSLVVKENSFVFVRLSKD